MNISALAQWEIHDSGMGLNVSSISVNNIISNMFFLVYHAVFVMRYLHYVMCGIGKLLDILKKY